LASDSGGTTAVSDPDNDPNGTQPDASDATTDYGDQTTDSDDSGLSDGRLSGGCGNVLNKDLLDDSNSPHHSEEPDEVQSFCSRFDAPALRTRDDIVHRRNRKSKRAKSPPRELNAKERSDHRRRTALAKQAQVEAGEKEAARLAEKEAARLAEKAWMAGSFKNRTGKSDAWTNTEILF
jgi:hypothetical protein